MQIQGGGNTANKFANTALNSKQAAGANEKTEASNEHPGANTKAKETVREQTNEADTGIILDLSTNTKTDSSDPIAEKMAEAQQLIKMFENMKQNTESAGKAARKSQLCLTIALRIMGGDKVPYKDEKFLRENDPALYGRAIQMRLMKEDPEEYESVLKPGDEKSDSSGSPCDPSALMEGLSEPTGGCE